MNTKAISTAQIGKCGELLVQQRLLLHGVESAHLTTDAGIDLVAYSTRQHKALTIQIKTNLKPKPGGGKGKLHLDWFIGKSSPAELFALVNLEMDHIWILTRAELDQLAQQRTAQKYHIFMATDPTAKPRSDGKLNHVHEFQGHILENKLHLLF